ncbi:hypothetical protein JJL45_01765 [Tamlana sp. s12]|uniref:hypothetical protein n=1 Tax=Tamlana sp. s12 TaxID=1630406 RepID=UPI000801DE7D|nr:hypothetical protein [Tamlana sp. s12]OBQ57075.1 hypothetical protein VQ01_00905 [Tamlana sp. s12]QQY82745.1 hypothetical protein JJL45_01765 [Tamlana sp. s12]
MDYKKVSRYVILGILFFLPVTFLLFLYPATHNYQPLDIVNESVVDLEHFISDSDTPIVLKDHITVLGFLGAQPLGKTIAASNLKELVYDKFKGFKRFQIVILMPRGTEEAVKKLQAEINSYEDMRFWHFVFGEPQDIKRVFYSLKSTEDLDADLATDYIFLVDKDLNQRGRLDDRTDPEIEKNKPVYRLNAYNCIEVAEIKNKMSDDLRIVFTEYRQKRKGEFNSDTRRANDLNSQNEEK